MSVSHSAQSALANISRQIVQLHNTASVRDDSKHVTMAGLTGVLPAGHHAFGVDCNDDEGQIMYRNAQVTAIALSSASPPDAQPPAPARRPGP